VEPKPEYQVAGHIDNDNIDIFTNNGVIHWAVMGNSFGPMMKELQEQVKIFEERASAHEQEDLDRGEDEDSDDLIV